MSSDYTATLNMYLNFVTSSQQILNNTVNIIRNQEVILRNLLTELRVERINNEIRNIVITPEQDISSNNTTTAIPIYINSSLNNRNNTTTTNTTTNTNVITNSTPSNTPSRLAITNNTENTENNENSENSEELLNKFMDENKIKRCKYAMIENKLNNVCPILGEEFNDNNDVIQISHCNHIISENELLKWFNLSKSCPLCKYNLDTDSYNTSITALQDNSLNDISLFLENNIENLLRNSQSFSIEYSLINPNSTSRLPIRRSRYPVGIGVRRTTYDNSPPSSNNSS